MLYSLKFKERKQQTKSLHLAKMRIMPPHRPRRRSLPHGCRQRESGRPLAVRRPPSALAGNLQTTALCQRIVVHGREAVLDEVMVANAEGERWRAPLSMLALDFDVVRLEERRPVVVVAVVVVLRERAAKNERVPEQHSQRQSKEL